MSTRLFFFGVASSFGTGKADCCAPGSPLTEVMGCGRRPQVTQGCGNSCKMTAKNYATWLMQCICTLQSQLLLRRTYRCIHGEITCNIMKLLWKNTELVLCCRCIYNVHSVVNVCSYLWTQPIVYVGNPLRVCLLVFCSVMGAGAWQFISHLNKCDGIRYVIRVKGSIFRW